MKNIKKLSQLQIRVSAKEKAAIQKAAKRARMGMSEWVLSKILPSERQYFHKLLIQLKQVKEKSFVLAEIHDLFKKNSAQVFAETIEQPLPVSLPPYWENYLAAMIEYAANQKGISAPEWLQNIVPLKEPVFVSKLESLRFYLLTHSPPPFRNRNIFIDASIGQRI